MIASGNGTLPGRRGRLPLHGTNATVYGVLLLGLAFFVHAHFFWGNTRRLMPYRDLAKGAGLLVLVAGIGCLAYRVLLLG